MADIDLDEFARARMEVAGKKRHAVVFKGKRFPLPAELPLNFQIYLARGDAEEALRTVFDGKVEDFLALGPSAPDFVRLTNEIANLYTGLSTGESSASGSSSTSTSGRSRRTSRVSTT